MICRILKLSLMKCSVQNLTSSFGITTVAIAVAVTGLTFSSYCQWIAKVTRSTAKGKKNKNETNSNLKCALYFIMSVTDL